MSTNNCPRIPSILKKFLMAITGLVLVLFVLGHMAGNLLIFVGPNAINAYALKLRTLPYGLLWIIRILLLITTIIHAWMGLLVTLENRRAHSETYKVIKTVQATLASKTMGITGSILLFFIVFHLLHFTTFTFHPEYKNLYAMLNNGQLVHDVYGMMIAGFSELWVSLLYIVCMGGLCLHLSHGVSSMFQSIGLRNNKWRYCFDTTASVYGWVIFLGFISIPIAVLLSKYTKITIFPL